MRINFSCINIQKLPTTIGVLMWVCVFSLVFTVTAYTGELTGTWTGTDDTGESYTFVFSKTDWSLTNDMGDDWYEGTYTFNENSKPKQLDLFVTGSSDNQFITETALYIYKIEGKTLTLTGSEPGSSYRPSEFSEGGSTRTFIVTNENMDTNDDSDNTEGSNSSDDDDNVKVYVNCFIGMAKD